MAFESVRAYVQLASGLTEFTRARAMEAAQGLLILPATGIATGTKMAAQVSALADELLAAATANRSDLTALVRSEVDAAIMTRLGLVPVHKLEEAQAEAASLREEIVRLSWASSKAPAAASTARKAAAPARTASKAAAPARTASKAAAPARTASKAAAPARTASKAAAPARTASKAARPSPSRSAVTTRAKPADT